jgi:dTDP-4-dehydrorhamnose 3,5-epimerase
VTFTETRLAGAFVIDPDVFEDERGLFARTFCRRELEAHGLDPAIAQGAASFSRRRGTLRGMHYQVSPHAQDKLVRCTRGTVYDVAVDLREGSPTCRGWVGVELTAVNRRMLYVPKGFAHGFLTLEDAAEVAYHFSDSYAPASERGFRWDDPAIGIDWPFAPLVVSARDRALPLLSDPGTAPPCVSS